MAEFHFCPTNSGHPVENGRSACTSQLLYTQVHCLSSWQTGGALPKWCGQPPLPISRKKSVQQNLHERAWCLDTLESEKCLSVFNWSLQPWREKNLKAFSVNVCHQKNQSFPKAGFCKSGIFDKIRAQVTPTPQTHQRGTKTNDNKRHQQIPELHACELPTIFRRIHPSTLASSSSIVYRHHSLCMDRNTSSCLPLALSVLPRNLMRTAQKAKPFRTLVTSE